MRFEDANAAAATAKPFTALQSLHRRSASITAVLAEGAEFAYLESFNDIDDDLMNSRRARSKTSLRTIFMRNKVRQLAKEVVALFFSICERIVMFALFTISENCVEACSALI